MSERILYNLGQGLQYDNFETYEMLSGDASILFFITSK